LDDYYRAKGSRTSSGLSERVEALEITLHG
jgi:hypothetical protein